MYRKNRVRPAVLQPLYLLELLHESPGADGGGALPHVAGCGSLLLSQSRSRGAGRQARRCLGRTNAVPV